MSEDVTLGEIVRKLDRHIEDSKQNSAENRQNNKTQQDMLTVLLTQSTESKGRIDGIIEKLGEHRSLLEVHNIDISSLKGTKKYYTGAIAILWVFIGFSPFIAGLYIRESVRDVLAQFEITVK